MKADLSRDTFNPVKHFLRVIQQQGRVQVDADWNEQASILIHYLQMLAVDLIGPHGGPADGAGFEIALIDDDLYISPGRYYVDGILCELEPGPAIANQDILGALPKSMSDRSISYFAQPDLPIDREQESLREREEFLVYLDVWERHLTAIDDESIREMALGGPDTSTRTKVVWQVRVAEPLPEDSLGTCDDVRRDWSDWVKRFQPAERGRLAARDNPARADNDPCITPPLAGFRGAENQLYRVEIRRSGRCVEKRSETGRGRGDRLALRAASDDVTAETEDATGDVATFVWSRENGSVLSAWDKASNRLTLADPGRDLKLGFAAGDWIELTDDARELDGVSGTLVKVTKVEENVLTIDEDTASMQPTDASAFTVNPKIRRWDSAGALEVHVPATNDGWIHLEDGVEIKFSADHGEYRSGDYWMIPARVLSGVEWPRDEMGQWESRPPRGVYHHFAPLALIKAQTAGGAFGAVDCRCLFEPLACNEPG